jgi:hypothetical protein
VTNPFYTPSGNPASHSKGLSELVRGEFTNLQAAFDLIDTSLGSGATTETARALAAEALLAPLASPHLSGTPTTPTATNGSATTQIASTAFVLGTRPEQLATAAADLSMGGNKITDLGVPLAATDAATKNYVDGFASGMQMKPTADAATASALFPPNTYANGTAGVGATLTATTVGVLIVDGIALVADQLVLVKNEAAQANNGLYIVTTAGTAGVAYILTRVTSMDQPGEFAGAFVPIHAGGTVNANTNWLCNPAGTVTVGTTAISFTQMNSATSLTGGANIQVAGNLISLVSSPALTGNPTTPTPTIDTFGTYIVNTAWIAGQMSTLTPWMDGTASAGIYPRMSRGDHVHPTDTSRYAASNPAGYQTAGQVGFAIAGKQDALGYTPIEQGGGSGQGSNKIRIGWSGSGLKAQVDGTDLGIIPTVNYPAGFVTAAGASQTYMPLGGGVFTGGVVFNHTATESSVGAFLVTSGISAPNTSWTWGISAQAVGGFAAQAFLTVSDGRLKDNIRDLTPGEGVDWVLRGRPRRYLLDGKPTVGFVAQEDLAAGREEAIGQLPSDDARMAVSDGFAKAGHRLIRDYQADIAFLTAALQNALTRIAALEARGT